MTQTKDEKALIIEKANKLAKQLRLAERSRAKERKQKMITPQEEERETEEHPFEKKIKDLETRKKIAKERNVTEELFGVKRGPKAWNEGKQLTKNQLLDMAKKAWEKHG